MDLGHRSWGQSKLDRLAKQKESMLSGLRQGKEVRERGASPADPAPIVYAVETSENIHYLTLHSSLELYTGAPIFQRLAATKVPSGEPGGHFHRHSAGCRAL